MADYVYVDNDLQLTLETNVDISTSETRQIRYVKPSGSTGYWTADLVGTTQLRKSITNVQLNEVGVWKFKAYVKYASGLKYQGDPVELEVLDHWQVGD